MNETAYVVAVHASTRHRFSKQSVAEIELQEGLGVVGDAHFGATIQHVFRIRRDPTAPNLRQVHLMHQELFDWLWQRGFSVEPGDLGENVTTAGIDLLGLPRGTRLHIGDGAVVEVTGLRNPCVQIDGFQQGLLKELVGRDGRGTLVRRAGIMGVVHHGGTIRPGGNIVVVLPEGPHEALGLV